MTKSPHTVVKGALYRIGGRLELPAGWRYTTLHRVEYLSPADKYHRFTRRLSKGQKVLQERALLASQRPCEPW